MFEGLGFSYYQGSTAVDDAELLDHQIDRYSDVYADEPEYRQLESFIGDFLGTLEPGRPYSSAEFLNRFGAFQNERGVDSITAAAYRAGVPVFSPGLADSGYGVAAFRLAEAGSPRVVLDQFEDMRQLGEIGKKSKTTSVIYVGGGRACGNKGAESAHSRFTRVTLSELRSDQGVRAEGPGGN